MPHRKFYRPSFSKTLASGRGKTRNVGDRCKRFPEKKRKKNRNLENSNLVINLILLRTAEGREKQANQNSIYVLQGRILFDLPLFVFSIPCLFQIHFNSKHVFFLRESTRAIFFPLFSLFKNSRAACRGRRVKCRWGCHLYSTWHRPSSSHR